MNNVVFTRGKIYFLILSKRICWFSTFVANVWLFCAESYEPVYAETVTPFYSICCSVQSGVNFEFQQDEVSKEVLNIKSRAQKWRQGAQENNIEPAANHWLTVVVGSAKSIIRNRTDQHIHQTPNTTDGRKGGPRHTSSTSQVAWAAFHVSCFAFVYVLVSRCASRRFHVLRNRLPKT